MSSNPEPIQNCPYSDDNQSVATKHTSATVETEKRKHIRLYPFRFGVFKQGCNESELARYEYPYTSNSQIKEYQYNKYDSASTNNPRLTDDNVDKYWYYPMPLRNGWVYVLTADQEAIYEYEHTNNLFRHSKFIKTSNAALKKEIEDIKIIIENERAQPYITIPEIKGVYLFYTEVRLSTECARTYLKDNFPTVCRAFNSEEWRTSDGKSLTDIKKGLMDTNDVVMFYPLGFDGMDESKMQRHVDIINNAALHNLEKSDHRDVFIHLYDPIGNADQISHDLSQLRMEHEVLLRSIRIGEDPELIKQKIENLAEGAILITDAQLSGDTRSLEQKLLIHSIGASLYQMSYDENNPHYASKGRRSLDKERLVKLLAVDERAEKRAAIENKRTSLAELIEHASFQNYYEFFANYDAAGQQGEVATQTTRMLLEAKISAIRSYFSLSAPSNATDKYIDIQDPAHPYVDPHKDLFLKLLDENEVAGTSKLLWKGIDPEVLVTDIKEVGSTDGRPPSSPSIDDLMALADTVLTSTLEILANEKKIPIAVNLLERLTGNNNLFEINQGEVDRALMVLKRKMTSNSGVIERDVPRKRWRIRAENVDEATKSIIINTVNRPTPLSLKLQAICAHPLYKSTFAALTLYNVGSVLEGYEEHIALGLGRSVEFGANVALLQRSWVEAKLGKATRSVVRANSIAVKNLGRQIKFFGAAGALAGATDSVYNSIMRFQANDIDATLCYAGSAAIGGLGGLAVIYFAQGAAGGWAGIIVAGLAFGLYWLGTILTDTELETFIKKTVFTDSNPQRRDDYNHSGKDSHELIEDLSSHSWRLAYARNDEHDANYVNLIEEFMLAHRNIPFIKVETSYTQEKYMGQYSDYNEPIRFNVKISTDIAAYIHNISEVEMRVHYVVKNWIGKDSNWNISDYSATGDSPPLVGIPLAEQPGETEIVEQYVIPLNGVRERRIFTGRDNGYVVVLFRMSGRNGTNNIPVKKSDEERFLIYQYPVVVEERRGRSGRVGDRYYNYDSTQAGLPNVFIGTEKEALNIK